MKKTELFLGLLVVGLGFGLWILSRQTAESVAAAQPQKSTPTAAVCEVPLAPIALGSSNSSATNSIVNIALLAEGSANDTLLQDQEAREVLASVGADDDADDFWMDAIFDTSLPDRERADLMEDLNEVGFDDPKNVTADDAPLIINRLSLIDDALPDADDFMTPHLLEAQKDLIAMLAKLTPPQ